MKKKSIITLSIILFLAIAITSIFLLTEQTGYATVLSIDDVSIEGNNQIRITAVAGTGADELVINLKESEINKFINDEGYEASKGISGRISISNAEKNFNIDKQEDENFINYQLKEIGRFNLCKDSNCIDEIPNGWVYANGEKVRSASGICACFYSKNVGTNGEFTGKSTDQTEITIKIGDLEGTIEPSSGNNILRFDSLNYAQWTGNLNNYEQITAPNYDVLFVGSKLSHLISDNAYSNHEDAKQDLTNKIANDYFPDIKGYESYIETFNNNVNTAIDSSKTANYKNSINAKSVTFENDVMVVGLKTLSVLPTIAITLDADSVGIHRLVGEPKIIKCADDVSIFSGDSDNNQVTVKNIGDEDGSFTGTLSCSGGKVTGYISETTIKAGNTANLPITLSGEKSTKGTDSASCKITVKDYTSGATDTCNFDVDVKFQEGLVCEPNTKKCVDDKTVRICSEDGSFYQEVECEIGCEVLGNGQGRCQGEITPDFEEDNTILYLIIAIIIGIAVILFMDDGKNKKKVK